MKAKSITSTITSINLSKRARKLLLTTFPNAINIIYLQAIKYLINKIVLKKIFLLQISLLFAINITAQDKPLVYNVYMHTGMIVKNWLTDDFPKRYPSALLELNLSKQSLGSENWHQYYGYPQVGLSIFTGYLGNQKEFGSPFGIVPTITLGALKKEKWDWKLTIGMGLTYFTQPFDSITNPHNILIGSSITNLSFARFWVNRTINKNISARLGFTVMHASNAHYQIPNVGMNIPNFSVGFSYSPTDFSIIEKSKNKISNKRWYFNTRLGYGIHEFAETIKPVGTPKYKIYVFSPYMSKRVGNLGQIDIGASIKYYESFYIKNIELELFPSFEKKYASVGSLMLGYEFLLNHFSLLAQGLLDVYNPFYIAYDEYMTRGKNYRLFLETWTSSRLGLQYYFWDTETRKGPNTFVGLFVDANFGEADFVEFSLGFKF